MAPKFNLLERRRDRFMLWIPGGAPRGDDPNLILGTFYTGPPATVHISSKTPLVASNRPGLWELNPNTISPKLENNSIYHYWFEITDTSSEGLGIIRVTDPFAYTVDYRVLTSRGPHDHPPSVIKFRDGKLWPCDIDGKEPSQVIVPPQNNIPDNNFMVIYELPTSWARFKTLESGDQSVQIDTGTFTDVLALFDPKVTGEAFKDVSQIRDEAIVAKLGVNALELLPAADARPTGEWGYATAHYYAPDFDLGTSSKLVTLVEEIHAQNVRLFTDVVMAFGHDSYAFIDFDQFHFDPRALEQRGSPDKLQSHSDSERDGYGGRLWRYSWPGITDEHGDWKPTIISSYDPETGITGEIHPSWAFHKGHLHRWMTDFGVGGLRLDSINNIANYDFIKAYKEYAWYLYNSRYSSPNPAKFLVIGEELSDPLDLITSGSLNALWNEPFQSRLRSVIIGESSDHSFEDTVQKLVNCTLDGSHPFTDGAQAINYITSHDTEGLRKERLYNYLSNCRVFDIERRAKLAFTLLLTAVGIPMIFAGEEFVDQMDRPIGQKQIDPVNYERKSEDWRTRVFDYVATLVKFRTQCAALGDDDTDFIHADQSRGGKIMAWRRGGHGKPPVVVVANFTDFDTEGIEYVVPNWPDKAMGGWREVTQGRLVPNEWIGREPLKHWEAKVYTY
ncbi:glycoside hydrolase superfamily [Tricladium varicosporioides]|nr:glycoside hydrolase superfamily [Hymenoscyphus varicosporioides]